VTAVNQNIAKRAPLYSNNVNQSSVLLGGEDEIKRATGGLTYFQMMMMMTTIMIKKTE